MPALGAMLAIYAGVRLSMAAGALTEASCTTTGGRMPGWGILLCCLVAFGAGRIVADRRERSDHRRRTAGQLATPRRRRAGALAVHVALALFLLFAVGTLAYETVGLWNENPWGLEPITHYVRCAKSADPAETTVVACIVAFFAGNWLSFPFREA